MYIYVGTAWRLNGHNPGLKGFRCVQLHNVWWQQIPIPYCSWEKGHLSGVNMTGFYLKSYVPLKTCKDIVHKPFKVGGADATQNGMVRNWSPCLVAKAVFGLPVSTCQYQEQISSVEKYEFPPRSSNESSILGKGCSFFIVQIITCM